MRTVFPAYPTGRFFNQLTSDMNTLVDSLFTESAKGSKERPSAFTPRMDVVEDKERFQLSLDLPGIDPNELNIDLDDETIAIHGHRECRVNTKDDETRHRVERTYGEFRRTIALPQGINQDGIEAEYTDGVLTVTLPKAAPPAARKVVVTHGHSQSTDSDSEAAGASDRATDAGDSNES